MRDLLYILVFITSFWIYGIQGQGDPGVHFQGQPYGARMPDTTPVGSSVIHMGVGGIVSSRLACFISSDDEGGARFFAVRNDGSGCVLTVKEDLRLVPKNSYELIIEARNTLTGINAFTSCSLHITKSSDELYCSDSANLTLNSNTNKNVEFDIPCRSGDGNDVIYQLRLPTQDLYVAINDTAGKIYVRPPVPCGVVYDYMSITAWTPERQFEVKIHFHIQHSQPDPPSLQLQLINVTGRAADFAINITHPRVGSGCASADAELSYQYILEVTKDGQLVERRYIFEKGTTSVYHRVSGLKPGTHYIAFLRTEGHFNSSASPVAFSTALDDNRYYNFTVIETYPLPRPWTDELGDKSSPEFLLTKFYVEDLIDHLMTRRPFYQDSELLYFQPNGMSVSLTELVNQTGQRTDIAEYLERQFSSGFEVHLTNTWTTENLKGIVLNRTLPSSLPIIEGTPAMLSCIFIIVHSLDSHAFQISWQLDDNRINLDASQTMHTEQERIVFTRNSTGMNIGTLKTYFYRHSLHISSFHPRQAGKYSCHMSMTVPGKMSFSKVEDSLYTDIHEEHVLKPAHVFISPLTAYTLKGSAVTVKCTFSGANEIVFVDQENKVLKTHISESTQGMVEITVNSSLHQHVRCQGHLKRFPMLLSKSEFVNIVFLEEGSNQCSFDVDYTGIQWETTLAGETAVQACPHGYQGYATRQCQGDGMWKPSNFIACIRDDWLFIKEEIRKVKEDGIDISSQFINNVATMIQTSLDTSSPILSSDIQQVTDILDDLGLLTFRNKEEEALVDYQDLDTFATITDTILASSDTQWEDVLHYETSNSNAGSGNKIVVAMDQLVASSMRTSSISNDPIVKEKIAIQPSTKVLGDINFPDASHEEYEKYDNWVLESGNKAFLSGSALKTDEMKYSVILLREVSSKMSVDTGRQNLSEHGKALQDKQVRSGIISFSLSRDINRLSPPLQMTFRISQDNFKNPVCGFLDATVLNGSKSSWSSEGCETNILGSDVVECLCSHLTNFAILMSPAASTDDDHEILSAITYAGCGISIMFLLITVIVHFSVWKYVKCDRVELHVHLSTCLLLSFAAFLAGIKRTENEIVCTVVAAVLHYLFLASFFLMLGEGIHIFLSVTIVFRRKSVLLKLLLMAYGVPLLIVGACLGLISKPSDYRRDDFCWLQRRSGAVWAFIGPAAVIILVNFVIFGLVVNTVLKNQSPHNVESRSEARSGMRALCVLSPILGLTWVFGLLTVNEDLVVFQYLFAAFNSLQGFFIFLFHCAFSSHVRNAIKASRRRLRAKSFDHIPKSSSSNQEKTSNNNKRRMSGEISEMGNANGKPLFERLKTRYLTDNDAETRTRKQSSSSTFTIMDAESYTNPTSETRMPKNVFTNK